MTIVKIIIIISLLLIAANETRKLIQYLDELGKFDAEVLQEALNRIPEEPENRTVTKVILPSPKTIREKLVGCLERILYKLKEH